MLQPDALPTLAAPYELQELVLAIEGPADEAHLRDCFDQTEALCTQRNLSEADSMAIRLTVDEVCTNVVRHAYSNGPPGVLRLEVWWPTECHPLDRPLRAAHAERDPSPLTLRVLDAGLPFDPADAPSPVFVGDLEDRSVGGLGWFFVRQFMDSVLYERLSDNWNVCTMSRVLARRGFED